MYRETLPTGTLAVWAQLNNVGLNGVKVSLLQDGKGCGLVAVTENTQDNAMLMRIPQELILSLENVWIYAKSDRHLAQVLEATGDYTRVTLTTFRANSLGRATHGKIGVLNPLSEYVKFLPTHIPIPTFWSEQESSLLPGTSLQAALASKLRSLEHEFSMLREMTRLIDWCQLHWWDEETGMLTFEDWKHVDAIYRSRALDLPGTGHAMVPCIDMANHASGNATAALYDTDSSNGDAVLILRQGKILTPGDEVTITYGDEKGACEMLFSYGFLERNMTSARELFLDLDIPDDDPLKIAKKAVSKSAPGFRLFEEGKSVDWEGSFIWLVVVNEEDGLEFQVLRQSSGETELQVSWKAEIIRDMTKLRLTLEKEDLWDVFNLRAVTVLQDRVAKQLFEFEGSVKYVHERSKEEDIESNVKDYAWKLRDLEKTLLLHAYDHFELQKTQLFGSAIVQQYLGNPAAKQESRSDEDFS
ncbi:hypothetical protein ACLMJK_006525 [Lecanora helva]